MRIGIDFDEVVADTLGAVVNLHNSHYGTVFKKEDVIRYELETVWGGTPEEWRDKMDEFLSSKQLEHLNPIADCIPAITALKDAGHELYIITARTGDSAKATELWLAKHLPGVFSGIHYAHFLAEDIKIRRKKSELCKENGIKLLIDDHLGTAEECAAAGIKVFLFDYPWNQSELPNNIERVFSWDDILAKLS